MANKKPAHKSRPAPPLQWKDIGGGYIEAIPAGEQLVGIKELMKRLEALMQAQSRIASYMVDASGMVTLERVLSLAEGYRWAIRRESGRCMNIQGGWEQEPSPSSRDEAFFRRCRFNIADAVKLIRAQLDPTFPNLEE